MMFIFYFVIYALFLLLAAIALPFNAKLRKGVLGRWGVTKRVTAIVKDWDIATNAPLWFHVASSGELEQCLPVLDSVKSQRPHCRIFVSYFSPTGKRALELEAKRRELAGQPIPWDASDFMPFDFPWSVTAFVKALSPNVFVAVHREIWPGVLRACQRRRIPCLLIATYFNRSPGLLVRRWLEHFDFVGTVNQATSVLLNATLIDPQVQSLGDPRIERVFQRKDSRPAKAWNQYFTDRPCLLLASVWPQDIAELETSLVQLIKANVARIIIAPHEPHPDFVLRLEQFLRDNGTDARRWSVWKENPDANSNLVVDKVGELAEIYQLATLAFVGGSFKSRVHNVLEPAAYGKPIITGPYIENSAEAVELSESGGLIKLEAGDQFFGRASEILTNSLLAAEISGLVAFYVASRRGADTYYATKILNSITWPVTELT
jgi:3-deoxy-D-manno-octulosonic-acid transferase